MRFLRKAATISEGENDVSLVLYNYRAAGAAESNSTTGTGSTAATCAKSDDLSVNSGFDQTFAP